MTKLKKETFEPLLNTKFTITFGEDVSYDVELVGITEGKEIPSLNIQPFTLMFKGDPSESIYTQKLYKIHSEKLGELSLFLIPRHPDKDGVYYESIIS